MGTPFDRIYRGRESEREDIRHRQELNFEESAVKRILAAAGVETRHAVLREEAETAGFDFLSFLWLRTYYPNFPVQLFFKKVPYVHTITVRDLFKKFTKTPIFKALSEILDEEICQEDMGLVFNWPQMGTMVLHNHSLTTDNSGSVWFVRRVGSPPITWTIEPFSGLIDSLVWDP